MQSKAKKRWILWVLGVALLGAGAFLLPEPPLTQSLVETPLDAGRFNP